MYFIIGLFVSIAAIAALVYTRRNEFRSFLKNSSYKEKVVLSLLIPFAFLLSIIAWPMILIASIMLVIFTIVERD